MKSSKKISLKDKVEEKDWNNFLEWTKHQKYFFDNSSFYTDILNLKTYLKIPKKFETFFWEFYFYNKNILNNKYDLFNDYEYVKRFESNFPNLNYGKNWEFFEALLIFWKNNNQSINDLFVFLKLSEKQFMKLDSSKNFEIFLKYLEFIEKLVVYRIDNFNYLLKYLNKNIIENLKKNFKL